MPNQRFFKFFMVFFQNLSEFFKIFTKNCYFFLKKKIIFSIFWFFTAICKIFIINIDISIEIYIFRLLL